MRIIFIFILLSIYLIMNKTLTNSLSFISISQVIIIFLLIFAIHIINIVYLKKKYPNIELKIKEPSNNTAFVFDLHGVVFKLNPIEVIKEFAKSPYKLKFASLIFYPKFAVNSFIAHLNGEVAEEVVLKIGKNYPELKVLVPTFFNAINAQQPIEQTVEIIKDLKAKGYKLFVFSNIGDQSVNILQKKFPDIFNYFDGVLSAEPSDNYLKKPNPQAFKKFLLFSGKDKSDLIFIDDKMKNIISAKSIGIPSVLFTTPYNLKKKLIQEKII